MDVKQFPIHTQTRQLLSRFKDPAVRIRHAHATTVDARKQVIGVPKRPRHPEDIGEPSVLRIMRNETLLVLHLKHGWSKTRCAEEMGVDRRVIEMPAGFSALPAALNPDLKDLTEEELLDRALALQGEWEDCASIWRTAQEIRDDLVHRLTSDSTRAADGGRQWQNYEVAVTAGMSTSLVAQVRKGSMNDWKRANPEEFKERRREREAARRNASLARLEEAVQGQESVPASPAA